MTRRLTSAVAAVLAAAVLTVAVQLPALAQEPDAAPAPADAAPADAAAEEPAVTAGRVAERLAFLPEVLATFEPGHSLTRADFLAHAGDGLGMVLQAGMTDDRIKVLLKPTVQDMLNTRILAACATEVGMSPDLEAARALTEAAVAEHGPEVLEGQTLADVVAMVAERQMILAWVDREIAAKVDIERADVDAFYELNRDQIIETPAKVHTAHILVIVPDGATPEERTAARQKIDAILQELQVGADFAELAKTRSEDRGTAAKGGDLGSQDLRRFVKPYGDAARALKPGETSGVVQTTFGYHIIRCLAITPPEYMPLDDRLRAVITEHLRETQVDAAVEKRLDAEIAARKLRFRF